jgi:cytochrome P450
MPALITSVYDKLIKSNKDIIRDENSSSWVILNAELVKTILSSRQFSVPDPAIRIEKLAKDQNFDVSKILDALHDAPLGKNGDEHKVARKQFAEHLRPRIEASVQAFTKAIKKRLDAILIAGEDVNLFSELLIPAMNSVIDELNGVRIEFDNFKVASPTQLFGSLQILNASRLKKLNIEIGDSFALDPQKLKKREMTLFSGDPTLGSLGLNLIHEIENNPGQRLCDINWTTEFIRSSTPFAERIATSDDLIEGIPIKQDDKLFLYLGALEENPTLYFGAGTHRCLGENLAKMLWESLASSMKQRQQRLELLDIEYRFGDFTFIMPINIQVRVTK